jgi:hypothetical protein
VQLSGIKAQMTASGDRQISLTGPDARATTVGRSNYVVGYNVQSAVDTETYLIVAHEITDVRSDKAHLSSIALKASEALGGELLEVLSDKGYSRGEEMPSVRRSASRSAF